MKVSNSKYNRHRRLTACRHCTKREFVIESRYTMVAAFTHFVICRHTTKPFSIRDNGTFALSGFALKLCQTMFKNFKLTQEISDSSPMRWYHLVRVFRKLTNKQIREKIFNFKSQGRTYYRIGIHTLASRSQQLREILPFHVSAWKKRSKISKIFPLNRQFVSRVIVQTGFSSSLVVYKSCWMLNGLSP